MPNLDGMDEFALIDHLTARYRRRLAEQLATGRARTAADAADGGPHSSAAAENDADAARAAENDAADGAWAPAPASDVQVDIGDDTAVVRIPPGEDVLLTVDTMVGGVHFRPQTMDWSDVGYKAVAASVSDVCAMGGRARFVLAAVAIPQGVTIAALEAVYDGIADICAETGCRLVGGDLVSTDGPLVITTTVQGSVPTGRAVRRGGARPGDVVFVTGTVGDSGAGLALLSQTPASVAPAQPGVSRPSVAPPLPRVPADEAWALARRHRRPRPQVYAGPILRSCGATALDDISDGLASELNEIAKASAVRLRIDSERIPLSPALQNFARARGEDPLVYAWFGGEDYELVGTAPAFEFARALVGCESVGVRLAQIGRVEAGDGEVVSVSASGSIDLVEPRGYNHFQQPHPGNS